MSESQQLTPNHTERYTELTPRKLTVSSSHNTYYVKFTILLDNPDSLWYTYFVDSHEVS